MVAEFFSFRPNWHQDDRVRPLVRQYQLMLNAVLRDHPGLENCAVRCCHCGIRFLTHPRNAHRRDLRCEFGCREHHRRQQANARSKKHYRTDKGRRHKKRLNGKRSMAGGSPTNGTSLDAGWPDMAAANKAASSMTASTVFESAAHSGPAAAPRLRQVDFEEAAREDVKLVLDGLVLDEVTLVNSSMLPYLAMVASVIEGHAMSHEKLLQLLRRSMRQRSFDRLPRREYVLGFLNQHPPSWCDR